MPFTYITENELLVSDFNIIEEVVDGRPIYRLEDWYQLHNSSSVPISYLLPHDDFDIKSKKAIVIGGNNSENIFQENNKAFFVSKKYFKYDSTKTYQISFRTKHLNSSSKIHVGFVGFTSRPSIIRKYTDNSYYNECLNIHNFCFSHDGKIVTALSDSITNMQHYVPINKSIADDNEYHEFFGYITGKTDVSIVYNENIGRSIDNPIPIRQEVEYVAPYFYINANSTDKNDNIKTVIDFIKVIDRIPFTFTQNTLIIPNEEVLNLTYYIAESSDLYAFEGYVFDGYVDGSATEIEIKYTFDGYVIPGYVDGVFDPFYLDEDYMFEDYV